jgi:hypothetical protein
MSNLPALSTAQSLGVVAHGSPSTEGSDELRPNQIWRIVRRNWWILLGGAVISVAAAEVLTRRTVPQYQATATLRVTDGNELNISAVYRQFSPASEIPTEATVLRSRTLAEDVVSALQLQLRLTAPRNAMRSQLFDSIRIAPDLPAQQYQLVRQPDGRFAISSSDTGAVIATARPGETISLGDAKFRLRPDAQGFDRIEISLQPRLLAAEGLVGALKVDQPSAAAKVLMVSYVDTDRELVWQVPNALVERFIDQRQRQQRSHARSTVVFLRGQLDTIARQLSLAENEVRAFRERFLVVDPQAEATGQVTQMIARVSVQPWSRSLGRSRPRQPGVGRRILPRTASCWRFPRSCAARPRPTSSRRCPESRTSVRCSWPAGPPRIQMFVTSPPGPPSWRTSCGPWSRPISRAWRPRSRPSTGACNSSAAA